MNVIKYIFIFLVTGVSAQTPTSLTVQKDLRVQGKTVLGGVSKIQDLTIYADTIRMSGLDGTGTFLTIDGSGDVTKGTIGAASVTGLSDMQVLYGSHTGTIDQDADFIYNDADNELDIVDNSGAHLAWYRVVSESNFGSLYDNHLQISGTKTFYAYEDRLEFEDVTKTLTLNVASGGSSHTLTFPNTQGSANTFLKNDGSGNLSSCFPRCSVHVRIIRPSISSAHCGALSRKVSMTAMRVSRSLMLSTKATLSCTHNSRPVSQYRP